MACCAALAALLTLIFSLVRRMTGPLAPGSQRARSTGLVATAFRPAPGHGASASAPVPEKIPAPSASGHGFLLASSAAAIIAGLVWLVLQHESTTPANSTGPAWLIKLACTGKATNRELAP